MKAFSYNNVLQVQPSQRNMSIMIAPGSQQLFAERFGRSSASGDSRLDGDTVSKKDV